VTDGHTGDQTGDEPVGLVTTGGTGQHPARAGRLPRARPRDPRRHAAQLRQAETGHAAFDKGCHLFGIELRVAPVDPRPRWPTSAPWPSWSTTRRSRSWGPRATTLRHHRPDRRARRTGAGARRGMHVDACLGGFILPCGEELADELGLTSRRSTSESPGHSILGRHPQVRLRFKGSSTLLFRDKPCARRSTSTSSTGAAASTCPPAWRVRARVG
jgi:hypothetical protein